MSTLQTRLIPTLLVAGILLVGCSHEKTKPVSGPVSTTRSTTTTASANASRPSPARSKSKVSTTRPTDENPAVSDSGGAGDSEPTGISACDDYLSSYIACHQAARIFSPGQLPKRYQAMRDSLMRDSKNSDMRPQLSARCNSLARQLREALHGKSCAVEPESESSSP